MSTTDSQFGKAYLKLKPNFTTLKPYLFAETSDSQLQKDIRRYERGGYRISIPYLTKRGGEQLAADLQLILNKKHFEGHQDNLKYLIIALSNIYINEQGLVRFSNAESTLRVESFIDQFNELFNHEGNDFKITFETNTFDKINTPKKKESKLTIPFKNKLVTDWIIKTLRDAITQRTYPLTIGTQLFGAHLLARISDRKYHFFSKDIPLNAYERKEPETIYTEVVAHICLPLLAYLNAETELKKTTQKHWSLPQIGFLVEVLIALGFYESKLGLKYKLGSKNPPVGDKKYLQTTLKNKIKQGLIVSKSGTLTFQKRD